MNTANVPAGDLGTNLGMRRLPAALCLAISLSAAGCASIPPSNNKAMSFDGRMLICLPGNQARAVEQYRAQPGSNAWTFVRAGSAISEAARAGSEERTWMVASPPRSAGRTRENPWDLAHNAVDGKGTSAYRNMIGDLRSAGASSTPLCIEPEIHYPETRQPPGITKSKQTAQFVSKTSGRTMTVCDPTSFHWPKGGAFAWHLSDTHTQLKSARDRVAKEHPVTRPGDRITVAILDTGYDDDHVVNPEYLDKAASRDFTEDPMNPRAGAEDPYRKGFLNLPGHGCSCMSVLAGNRVTLPDGSFDDYLGGAPEARVIFLRITDGCVHLRPIAMTMAIRYAVAQGADVISLSQGGLPSRMLVDAVNEAYENGTAIFAASGDFLEVPILGLSSPRQMVFPAAFSRVVGVCGATANGRTYAKPPTFFTLLAFRKWNQWMLRGNFGPDEFMDEAIATPTPNVTWARYTHKGNGEPNLVDLDGAGTSVATPQAAAAAALWMQAHRDDAALAGKWRSWEKVEATYLALFDSAEKRTPEGANTFKYFGNGLLKAEKALDMGVPRNMRKRPPARLGPAWIATAMNLASCVESLSGTRAPAERSLHEDMVETEIAQLVHGSVKVQAIVEQKNIVMGAAKPPPPETTRLFLQALKQEKRCSKYLRGVIEKMEAALPPPVDATIAK